MEIASELSDLVVVMQQKYAMFRIFHKIFRQLDDQLQKYKNNSNNLEENDEEEKEPINIELTDKKTDPYNDENSIDSKWSDLTEENEEDIVLANFIESLNKSKLMKKFFQKSNLMIAVSYIMKRKIKKIFYEVISNSKIFNIKFC